MKMALLHFPITKTKTKTILTENKGTYKRKLRLYLHCVFLTDQLFGWCLSKGPQIGKRTSGEH
jgi:hypothetical protein